jgi:hypothetical protein
MAGGDSAMLEFGAHGGGIQMKGAHLIRFNAGGEILDIDLIARPAKAVVASKPGVTSTRSLRHPFHAKMDFKVRTRGGSNG